MSRLRNQPAPLPAGSGSRWTEPSRPRQTLERRALLRAALLGLVSEVACKAGRSVRPHDDGSGATSHAASSATGALAPPASSSASTAAGWSDAAVEAVLRRAPIEHVVVLVKENRTYDALFASRGAQAGFSPGNPLCPADAEAVVHDRERALQPERQLACQHPAAEVAFYHALASRYALCARFFSEVRGPSLPNHLMLIAAEAPVHDNPPLPPTAWQCPRYCFDLRTIADQLTDAGLSWRSYDETHFVSSFWMIRHLRHSPNVVSWRQFETDARAGRLPNVSFVFSEFADSEHPPESLCRGQRWTHRELQALADSPQWSQVAAFIVWDDWGGFRDHVIPPTVERDARGRPLRYGYRVPCLVVSPYAREGYLSQQTQSHLSILQFIEQRFGLPPLNDRVSRSGSLADCFDFDAPPRAPWLPAAPSCPRKR